MATAVGFRSGMFSNWTGSLSELDSCGNLADEYLTELVGLPYQKHSSWSSENVDFAPESLIQRLQINGNTSNVLTVNRCLSILRFIHKRVRHRRVTAEQLKHLPWILFSSVIDKNEEKRSNLMEQSHESINGQSDLDWPKQSTLIGALFDANVEKLLQEQRTYPLFSKPRRRQCNSESDLSWPLSGTQYFPPENHEHRSVCSADSSASAALNSSLHSRFGGVENLADSALFDAPKPKGIDTELSALQEDCADIKNKCDSLSFCEPTDCIQHPANVLPVDSTSPSVEEKSIPKAEFHCDCLIPEEPIHVESPVRPVLNSVSQAVPKTDSSATLTSILSVSSSMHKLPKSVSFADEVGKSLTEVFEIKENNWPTTFDYFEEFDGLTWPTARKPKLSGSCFASQFTRSKLKPSSDLQTGIRIAPRTNRDMSPPTSTMVARPPTSPCHTWSVRFPQPASQYLQFRQRIENGAVSLESISITQPTIESTSHLPTLSGTIKVKNVSFEKQVWLRLTTDNWQSYTDHMALYNSQLSGSQMQSSSRFDTFTFNVQASPQLNTTEQCEKIEFAIRYVAGLEGSSGQYWDNNDGKNYVIERHVSSYSWSSDQLNKVDNNSPTIFGHRFDTYPDYGSGAGQHFNPYTPDYRPNFAGMTQFTNYRAWNHFAGESTYY